MRTVEMESPTHPENSIPSSLQHDVEKNSDYAQLTNTAIRSYAWEAVTVTVKDRETKQPKAILSNVNGIVKSGEMLAIMGPSGCGKTTLLNVLAHRDVGAANTEQSLWLNGRPTFLREFRRISSYVEQEDALLGALTVKETLYFAAKLSLSSSISKVDRMNRIEALLGAFGLQRQSNVLVGTPIRKGISGGQKRRLSVASQLITGPKILFLDEPTSGLDSQASFEVMSFVKNIAVKHNLLVIASIHQPSTTTFSLFDKLLLLSNGRSMYSGPVHEVGSYFAQQGYPMPQYINPAEFVLELVNTDFATDESQAAAKLQSLHSGWEKSEVSTAAVREIEQERNSAGLNADEDGKEAHMANQRMFIPFTLVHRNFIKSYRDIVAYGIRIAMYLGLAIMMGTVWLRLRTTQQNIESFTNAIFFGGAFMSFMAVAYIPSYLEDRSLYIKERANGLYGPTSFMLANFIIGLPFLFVITILFSVVVYWLSNFQPTAIGFWTWVMWLFLDLVAAESLVILITNLIPIFVVALAGVAFANGLWMSVNGFMVPPKTLNVFWRYVFHYIDYQAYVFQGMMVNEFKDRTYDCERLPSGDCHCSYATALESQCKIDGMGVLNAYGYNEHRTGLWVGILICIIVAYRVLAWLILYLRKH